MRPALLKISHQANATQFLLWWTLTTIIAWATGAWLIFFITQQVLAETTSAGKINDIVHGLGSVVFSLTTSFTLGSIVQWMFLRSRLSISSRWIEITALSSLVGLVISFMAGYVLSLPVGLITDFVLGQKATYHTLTTTTTHIVWICNCVILGVILGISQQFVLREHLLLKNYWVWATTLSLIAGFIVATGVAVRADISVIDITPVQWGVLCGIGGGVYNVITGSTLLCLIHNPQRMQMKEIF